VAFLYACVSAFPCNAWVRCAARFVLISVRQSHKENPMRHISLIAGALLALGATACANHQHPSGVTTYSRTPSYEYGNPNYQSTASGGDSDMGSAGGEAYGNAHYTRTMQGTVPEAEQYETYEAAKNPRDAGTGGGKDAGTY
jgi:hypothetical protein